MEDYVTKYAKARGITEVEALTHKIVKEYLKNENTTGNAMHGVHTDFKYELCGEHGLWLEITKIEEEEE